MQTVCTVSYTHLPIISAAPIELSIANRENKRLRIQGDVDLRVPIPCSRCLEEVPTDIHFSIDKDIKLEDSVVHDEDVYKRQVMRRSCRSTNIPVMVLLTVPEESRHLSLIHICRQ